MKSKRRQYNSKRHNTKSPLVVSIEQSRKILGAKYANLSDEAVENMVYSMQLLVGKSIHWFQK